MKRLFLATTLMAISAYTIAAPLTGQIVAGGGVDDLALVIKLDTGKTIDAYCNQKCGDWFDVDPETEAATLKKKLKGRRVEFEYQMEKNRGRIAGPADDDVVPLMKKIKLLP